jgi:hypothetical protein
LFPDIPEVTRVLRHVRFGSVLSPEQLEAQLKPLAQRPSPMANYALTTEAPNWLIDRFDPEGSPLEHKMVVYPTADRRDHLLALLLQSGGVQLRWLMQLSDPGVQRFFIDALQQQALTMLLSIENTRQMAAMGLRFGMLEPQSLRDLLASARPSRHGITPLVQLTTMYSNARFGPSIIEGHEVTDAVAVLVGSGIRQQLEAAARTDSRDEVVGHDDAKLH